MEILKNQTIYQCEYCNKKLLSRNGAKIHESLYCYNPSAPRQKAFEAIKKRKQENCKHENTETIYSYIPGECVQQPDHDVCVDCNAVV